ncbi:hypothetical protein SAMN05216404_10891 [Nitrosospira multiformis]|uniref:Uncharacterized protein n=1 Tax=Nitrosospira multiformis TaxID=1231 RepID=A0A1H8KBD1_9PROT|nr:hypothetical protein SAMN05216404_10891 [Nitrosospira multiformis]
MGNPTFPEMELEQMQRSVALLFLIVAYETDHNQTR